MARIFNPPHPGLTLNDDVLPALGLTVAQAAQQLDVYRVALSRVLNGRAAISPEMALRLEAWLGVERGGEARLWLAEQSAYDSPVLSVVIRVGTTPRTVMGCAVSGTAPLKRHVSFARSNG